MKVEFDINKKTISIILIVAIIVIVVGAYIGGYIRKPVVYKSEREASDAVTDIGSSVEQIGSIIEDIDKKLGG